jgi:MtN3 and saliva related transmembrane protein
MDLVTLVGAGAALCSTVSFAPQAFKIIRTRDVSSISTAMHSTSVAGFALWLSYGLMKQDWPILITNTVMLAVAGFIPAMKLMPGDKREKVAETLDPET